MERRIDRLANKMHIELRNPQTGVSVRERTSAPRTLGIKFETEPFDIGGVLYNGAVMDLTAMQVHALIRQLERGVTLMERADIIEANPSNRNYK